MTVEPNEQELEPGFKAGGHEAEDEVQAGIMVGKILTGEVDEETQGSPDSGESAQKD